MALFRPASPKDPANTNRAHPILRRADFQRIFEGRKTVDTSVRE